MAAEESEDALLLRQFHRRVAGEVASVGAAVALADAAPEWSRPRLMEIALSRLDGFGELNRLLGRVLPARVEVASRVSAVCVALCRGRPGVGASRMDLDLRKAWASDQAARRLMVVAAALVEEAASTALRDRAGRLRVALMPDGADGISLTVEDDGPGPRLFARGSEADEWRTLAADLVGRGDGTLTLVTGRRGTRVVVALPNGLEDDGDDFLF